MLLERKNLEQNWNVIWGEIWDEKYFQRELTRRRIFLGKKLKQMFIFFFSFFSSFSEKIIKVSEEVQNAISERRPVVALESTIITHGMPYPENLRY